jgi:hypothetical protein
LELKRCVKLTEMIAARDTVSRADVAATGLLKKNAAIATPQGG